MSQTICDTTIPRKPFASGDNVAGRAGSGARVRLTDEPNLHLVVDGRRVKASDRRNAAYVFWLPARPQSVRIVSRSIVPQELGVSWDSRTLGVALRQIIVRRGVKFQAARADDARLVDGFHAFEKDNGFIWTDGDAALPTDLFGNLKGPVEVVLLVASTTQYIEDGVQQRVA